MASDDRQWTGKTGGGDFGQRFLLRFFKSVPVVVLYPVLYLTVPFYAVANAKEFKCIYQYFREIHRFSKWKSFWKTWHNHLIFGQIVLDRFAVLAGNSSQFHVTMDDDKPFLHLFEQPGGFVIAGAHVGNFELIGHLFKQTKKPINIIVFGGENANLQQKRQDSFGANNVKMIPVSKDLSHVFAVKTAIDNGEVVAIAFDRVFGSDKTLEMSFMHRKANFPLGPFLLAAQANCPVVCLTSVKIRRTTYRGFAQVISAEEGNLRSRSQQIAEQYVAFLEKILRFRPEQWFNFYDFWKINR